MRALQLERDAATKEAAIKELEAAQEALDSRIAAQEDAAVHLGERY